MLLRKLYYIWLTERQQHYPKSRLKELQLRMLQNIVEHAYYNTIFYRRLMDKAGVYPEMIEELEDIKLLPITTKNMFRGPFNTFLGQNIKYGRYHRWSTSGSTGSAMEIIFDENAWDYLEAIYLRALRAVGYKPWNPLAYYWYEPFNDKWYNHFFMRKELIPCWLSEEEQLKKLIEVNPKAIYYFASSLYFLALKILGKGLEGTLNPEVIISHAEPLSQNMRAVIEEAFGCNVYDQYGTTEFNRLGWECLKGGYHIDADSVYMEFEDAPFMEKGKEVIITGLINYTIPLIRYQMNDIALLSKKRRCACGSNLPLIKSIEGRKQDLIKAKSGYVPPKKIINRMVELRIPFRVVQLSQNKILVETTSDVKEAAIKRKLADLLPGRDIITRKVSLIKKTKHGKILLATNSS